MILRRAGRKTLAGQRVVVTRSRHQAKGLLEAFQEIGAQPELLPLLEIEPTPAAELRESTLAGAGSLERFQWIAFTSTNAVEAFLAAVTDLPSTVRLAAVGGATADALRRRGLAIDLVPPEKRAEGLVAALAPRLPEGARVLLPQADDARPVLGEGLRAAGARVETVVAYRKSLPADARDRARRLFLDAPLGWVTFTSPRIVESFVSLFADSWLERRASLLAASIGPVTSGALASFGVSAIAQAADPSDAALVNAVASAAAHDRD